MAATIDLVIEQGATFKFRRTWYDSNKNPVDLTGATGKMHIREDYGKDLILELSTENGRMFLNLEPGRIDLEIAATDTEALDFSRALYDVEITKDGDVTRLFEGVVRFRKQITE